MASKKDLIEAQGFSRRRLLTAFTAGAPGGKELEPAKPMRAVVAGISLAVLVIIAGVFYGLLKPGLPSGWETNTLILVSDNGARYLSSEGTLYPVVNSTSAKLLTPKDNFSVITTDSGSIAEIPVGPSIGIVGAPDDVPAAQSLVNDGWLACPVQDGTSLTLEGDASSVPTSQGAVVTSDGVTYVISGSYRYPVSPDAPANAPSVLRAVGLAEVIPFEVDSRWLNLFTAGSALAPITVPGAGDPVAGSELVVGQVVIEPSSPAQFLVTQNGELQQLSPLAYQFYMLGTGTQLGQATEVAAGATSGLGNAPEAGYGTDWPESELSPTESDSALCATLEQQGQESATMLATSSAPASEPGISIPTRSGALVAAGGQGDQAVRVVVLVDESGTSFAIPAADEELLGRLGYTPDDVGAVPSDWMQFFAAGPALTIEGAQSTPQGANPLPAAPAASASPEPSGAVESNASANSTSSVDSASSPQQCEPGTFIAIPATPEPLGMLQSAAAATVATGDGVLVAVVDSGIDAENEHLAGAVVDGIDLVGDGTDPLGFDDLNGHGTAIAGAIGARPTVGSGVVGIAPDVSLLSVRVYRSTDDQSVEAGFGPEPQRIAQGIRWAVDRGASVINVSLSNTADNAQVRSAVEYADAHGALVVASAGNRATTDDKGDSVRFPAAYPEALAVTAISSEGLTTVDSIHGEHVEVAAPGQNVLTAATGGIDCLYGGEAPSSSYSTAYASGAAALVAQAHPTETPQQWQYRLMSSATRGNPDLRTDDMGWGAIQPYDAMVMVPGGGERGPANPFTGTAALAVEAPVVTLPERAPDSPLAVTRAMLITAGIGAAVVLGTLGTLLVYRRRSDAVPPTVDQGEGLLDSMKGETTRILS